MRLPAMNSTRRWWTLIHQTGEVNVNSLRALTLRQNIGLYSTQTNGAAIKSNKIIEKAIRQRYIPGQGNPLGISLVVNASPRLCKVSFRLFSDQAITSNDLDKQISDCIQNGLRLYNLAEIDQALEEYRKAIDLNLNSATPDKATLARIYVAIANAYIDQDRLEDAITSLKQSISVYESMSLNCFELAVNYREIGVIYSKLGKLDIALENYSMSVKIHDSIGPNEEVVLILQDMASMYMNQGDILKCLDCMQKAVDTVEKIPHTGENLSALYHNLSLVYQKAGNLNEAIKQLEKCLSVSKTIPKKPEDLAKLHRSIGEMHRQNGNIVQSLENYEESAALYQKRQPNDFDDANFYAFVGGLCYQNQLLDKSLMYYNLALSIFEKVAPDCREKAILFNSIGILYIGKEEYKTALKYLMQSLLLHQTISNNHLLLAMTKTNIATAYTNLGQYSNALHYLQESLIVYEKIYPGSSDTAVILNSMGTVYTKLNRNDEAIKFYQRSYDSQTDKNNEIAGDSLHFLGTVYKDGGQLDKALDYLHRALILYEQESLDSPYVAEVCANLGSVYDRKEMFNDALVYFLRSLKIQLLLNSGSVTVASLIKDIGSAYLKNKNYEEALRYFHRSLELYQNYSPYGSVTASLHQDIATAYESIGDMKNFQDHKEQAEIILEIIEEPSSKYKVSSPNANK